MRTIMIRTFIVIILMTFTLSHAFSQEAYDIVATAKLTNGDKIVLIFDNEYNLISIYSVNKSIPDGFIWNKGSSQSLQCCIEVEPFKISISEANKGNSLRISRKGKLIDLSDIKYGVHGSDLSYGSIVKVRAKKIENLKSAKEIDYSWIIDNEN